MPPGRGGIDPKRPPNPPGRGIISPPKAKEQLRVGPLLDLAQAANALLSCQCCRGVKGGLKKGQDQIGEYFPDLLKWCNYPMMMVAL